MGHAIIIFLFAFYCRFIMSDEEKEKMLEKEAQEWYEEGGTIKWER